MITADGRAVQPQATAYRQVARAWPLLPPRSGELRRAKAFWLKRLSIFKNHPRYMYGICGMSLN